MEKKLTVDGKEIDLGTETGRKLASLLDALDVAIQQLLSVGDVNAGRTLS